MKYLITISYDGSKYYGLQKLNRKKTVQGELEAILTKINELPVSLKAAGRTDKGVHAINQKCHFELTKEITPYKLRYYLNRMTSKNLYVKECTIIKDADFHARFSVKAKTYEYKINVGTYDPILNDYIFNYNKVLDIKYMKKCCKAFVGAHNYKAFVVGAHKTYNSEIDNIDIFKSKNVVTISITGRAFYTYMVRNIVSVLILASERKINKQNIEEMLTLRKKIIEYAPAPPCGLYLKQIYY